MESNPSLSVAAAIEKPTTAAIIILIWVVVRRAYATRETPRVCGCFPFSEDLPIYTAGTKSRAGQLKLKHRCHTHTPSASIHSVEERERERQCSFQRKKTRDRVCVRGVVE
mmetsp:Transcript_30326/g.33973  ORF Transcript_30326/g.33973 Transcript_30326/m.33973 type:complete len:111 (-) Transcript_30326:89-421(-)